MDIDRIKYVVGQIVDWNSLIIPVDEIDVEPEELEYLLKKFFLKKEFDSEGNLLGYSCAEGCLTLLLGVKEILPNVA